MKKLFFVLGLLCFLLVAFFGWRLLHPPLTDEQQIAANLDSLSTAVDNRSAKDVMWFFTKDFSFLGTKKKDLQPQLAAGFLRYRVVDLKVNDLKVDVNGDSATSDATYRIELKSEANSSPEIYGDKFKLRWKKVDGEWKIAEAQSEGVLPKFGDF